MCCRAFHFQVRVEGASWLAANERNWRVSVSADGVSGNFVTITIRAKLLDRQEEETAMTPMSWRSFIGIPVGLLAASPLARPYIANAVATTATVWINQGFVPAEDEAFRKTAADYEKASGNKLDYNILPFMALNQKAISALTSGDVPDLIFHDAPQTILPQNAWDDKLTDVSDIVEPQKSILSETAVLGSSYYNNATRRRSYYLVPIKQAVIPFHIWVVSWRKPASNCRTLRRPGTRSMISLNPCRSSSENRACERCMPWVCHSPRLGRTTATASLLIS